MARSLAGAYSWIGTEPTAADGAGSFAGLGHRECPTSPRCGVACSDSSSDGKGLDLFLREIGSARKCGGSPTLGHFSKARAGQFWRAPKRRSHPWGTAWPLRCGSAAAGASSWSRVSTRTICRPCWLRWRREFDQSAESARAGSGARRADLAGRRSGQDPLGGHLFVFRSRRGDRLKILVWDRDGFVLWYKRLETGVFKLPKVAAGARSVELRASELAMVLDGIDVSRLKRVPRYERPQKCGEKHPAE